MRYKIPRYIDYKAKIVGPATFSQLAYVGIAGFIIIFLYLIMKESPFFIPSAVVLGGVGVSLAFLQVGGDPLPEYIKKIFFFSISSKEYIWEKKIVPMESAIPKRRKTPKGNEKEEKEEGEKQTKKRGKLSDIASKIETL